MKRNETQKPWEPNQADQQVDARLYKEGLEQLCRDALRFMELLPDVMMTNVKIHLKLAFPLSENPTCEDVLSKEDFENENKDKLLKYLGIHPRHKIIPPTATMEETFRRIVCRYIGPHSQVRSKTASESYKASFEALQLATKGTETYVDAGVSNILLKTEDGPEQSVAQAVSNDSFMQKVRKAKIYQSFGENFQKHYPKICLKGLDTHKDRFLVLTNSRNYPLFGQKVIATVLHTLDESISHQGKENLIEILDKQKYVLFDENGNLLEITKTVNKHVKDCADCIEVRLLKDILDKKKKSYMKIPEETVARLLTYADKRHQGYAKAFTRIKTWCKFQGIKSQVIGFQTALMLP